VCNPASFVVTKERVFWSKKTNSHSDIVIEHNLYASGVNGVNVVNVELVPTNMQYALPVEQWHFRTDQCEVPDWYDEEDAERRVRVELPEWQKYHCCSMDNRIESARQSGGDYVIQVAAQSALQSCGWNSTQVARQSSVQCASEYAMQQSSDCSYQQAADQAVQSSGWLSVQHAGSQAMQRTSQSSVQIATHYALQSAHDRGLQVANEYAMQRAGYSATQVAGNYACQHAASESVQIAGNDSSQRAGNRSVLSIGRCSVQVFGDGSTVRAKASTVQIGRSREQALERVTRVVGEEEADKWYFFESGVWSECTDAQKLAAEKAFNRAIEWARTPLPDPETYVTETKVPSRVGG